MKKLNTQSITNELVHSSFFPGRSGDGTADKGRQEPVPPQVTSEPSQPTRILNVPLEKVVTAKVVARPANLSKSAERRYVRRTFDIFEDQLAYLTKASLEERLAGGEGSMNAMVREAIEDLIRKRSRK